MKKKIALILACVMLLIVLAMGAAVYKRLRASGEAQRATGILPDPVIRLLQGTPLGDPALPGLSDRLIINYFDPGCEHCQYMAKSYRSDSASLRGVRILMITMADSAATEKFTADYSLRSMPNVLVYRDARYQFYNLFNIRQMPSFFVYRDQQLVKKVVGETKIKFLLN